ncbi:MAG: hypothetical protein KGJ08_07540, partial [Gammaproteobacteria bacterium]|nr:hypothetical protein [Gammaproteobacteria bacterium]
MRRRYGLLIPLSAFLIAAALYNAGAFFFAARLPMNIALVDGHTAEISPLAGTPLPEPLVAGDRIELGQLDASARAGVDIALTGKTFPVGHTYEFKIRRNGGLLGVPVTTISTPSSTQWRWIEGTSVFVALLLGVMSLLLLWYGRNRAARGMTLWSVGYVIGIMCNTLPVDGTLGVVFLLMSDLFFVLARIGFYLMADSLVGPSFSARTRMLFHTAFIVFLTVGVAQPLVGTAMLALTGW